jgi:predicted DsbA family dithiol-disulfide isomerase
VLWSDYICPWAYAGTDRLRLIRALGVDVVIRPFELHPDIPFEGKVMRPGSRTAAVHQRIAGECEAVGLPFRMPQRVPRSRLALEVAEHVRTEQPAAFEALHAGLFRAHFVESAPIDDPDVVQALVDHAGGDGVAAIAAVERGRTAAAVESSKAEAVDAGASGTPSVWFEERLLVPGLQPRDLYERIIAKLASKT